MGLGELLDQLRALYMTRFVATVEQLRQNAASQVLLEVVLRDEQGNAVRDGALGLPIRLDAVVLSGESGFDQVSVDSESILSFDRIAFPWTEELEVAIHPFPWDRLVIRVPTPSAADWRPLVVWCNEWFREDEDADADPLGVVHFFSDPEIAGDGYTQFVADLGSAPTEAFEGLLDAVAALGVKDVILGEEN